MAVCSTSFLSVKLLWLEVISLQGLGDCRPKLCGLVPVIGLYVGSKLAHSLGSKPVLLGDLPPLGQKLIAVHVALRLPRAQGRRVPLLRRGLLLAQLPPNLLRAFRELLAEARRHALQ